MALFLKKSQGQFKGVLHYENDYVDQYFGTKGKVITQIYESGPHIRIEAIDNSFTKKDATKQNTLLVDYEVKDLPASTFVTSSNYIIVNTPDFPVKH